MTAKKHPWTGGDVRAIQTEYSGVPFRSRLEARWAQFFDAIGVRWIYEPEAYTNGTISYLPDFWLPEVWHRASRKGLFFEVKPCSANADEQAKAIMLACGTGLPVIVASVPPTSFNNEDLADYLRKGDLSWEDSGLVFAMCEFCDAVDIGFYASDEPECPSCKAGSLTDFASKLYAARSDFGKYSVWKGERYGR